MIHRHPFLGLLSGAYLVFVGWLTLTPQPIDSEHQQLIYRGLDALHRRGYAESVDYTRLELLANIALFVPIGVFAVVLLGARWWWLVVVGCLSLTAVIEAVQHRIPGRVPDERDLFANSLGGIVGVVLALVLTAPGELRRRRERRRHAQRQPARGAMPAGRR